ncbi:MAG: bifunctional glutamate N-acetyltransferase/amino-acid acetyltransferase ArgJ [Bacteriovoracaceae bacterium]|nr:bifunctional glutamate N-acetyltransferase/amino-acid acetyltransferase ArgJ [Bacteriovoracaceae bacterium]
MTPGPGVARTLLPKGFFAAGINCGVRKYRPDLGLIMSDVDAVGAGVFTQSTAKAAPVKWSQELVPSGQIRAIVTNSGQANAATGELGVINNLKMVEATAKAIGCNPKQVLSASTGVIGVHMMIDLITEAMPELHARLTDTAENFAVSILTTDLVPKTVTTLVELSKGSVRVTGISKGSGMIHPNMATMLGYILTDAAMTPEEAKTILKTSTDLSFNMVSVDGDTSTNDCSFLLANGASGVKVETVEDFEKIQSAITGVSQLLAKAIARDGEGATKLIEIKIEGSNDLPLARKAARGLTISPLFKSAIHGEDPNWGRILARLGAEGIPEAALNKMELHLQGEIIFKAGAPVAFDRDKVRGLLRSDTVFVNINLFDGSETATAWGCDLSKKYVEINTEYT